MKVGQPVPPTGAVAVRPVAGRADLRRFIHLPWRFNASDPSWVPPLLRDVRAVLSPSHPFHRHAEMHCFLAWRGTEPVGRVAAIINQAHIDFHKEPVGFFGLFECTNDPEAAQALLLAAASFVRDRGLEILRGPFNLSTNDELASPGILIDGFERPPSLLMSHNPPYYAGLVEAAGFVGVKDLIAYWIADAGELAKRLQQSLERVEPIPGLRIRPVNMGRLSAEIALIQDIYNAAWSRNWGFVPMTPEEITHLADKLKPIVDPALCIIAEIEGEAVAFGLAAPDFNQVLKRINGRLFPFGLPRLLWYWRSIDAARMIALGVKADFRHRGLDQIIIMHVFAEATRKGLRRGECSWILEDNQVMRHGIERLGGVADKTYRVYQRRLT